jgi:hypothetical protein
MASERSKQSLEREHYIFALVQKYLPVDVGPEDGGDGGRWPQSIMAIAVSLILVRILVLGFPSGRC